MKNANLMLRMPKDFRHTVTVLNADPLVFVQRYIDQFFFYPFFSQMDKMQQSVTVNSILTGMMGYQRSGNEDVDLVFQEISHHYFLQLMELSRDPALSAKQQQKKSKSLIGQWEKKAAPLLNYPTEITLEGAGVLRLTFDFMLVHVTSKSTVTALLEEVMKRLSLAVLHAHKYSNPCYKNQKLMDFFIGLFDDQAGLFLPDSKTQAAVRKEYEPRFMALLKRMGTVKSYDKRLPVFRALIKEWYTKLIVVNE